MKLFAHKCNNIHQTKGVAHKLTEGPFLTNQMFLEEAISIVLFVVFFKKLESLIPRNFYFVSYLVLHPSSLCLLATFSSSMANKYFQVYILFAILNYEDLRKNANSNLKFKLLSCNTNLRQSFVDGHVCILL